MKATFLARAAIAISALAATLAQAGGPLGICNSAPLKYSGTGTVNLNYDNGPLGVRTKAQADAIVNAATALWTNVPTSTVVLGRGADLPGDVNTANYTSYLDKFSDGLNPVIYDNDGTLTDLLLGTGSHNSVLGFAGSASYGSPTCRYAEGQAVINGGKTVGDSTMITVIAHELGHLIGLDHTQLDSSQGLAGANYPLMYPIAFRTVPTLHEDDVAAISALYPDATVPASYGTLQGNFTLGDAVTPIRGANIWAQNTLTGQVFSGVSDYLAQGNGSFKMLVPPGSYTLHAEAIDTRFNGGSSVGPYSDGSTDRSFAAPMYSGTTPMAPLTLGLANVVNIPIVAGCVENAAFRLDGTGLVTGNCGAVSVSNLASRLSNLSTRGQVLTGNDVMIAGFIIGGTTPKTVVVNVAGPSLVNAGIANALSNPMLNLVRASDNTVIASNDNWQSQAAASVSAIQVSGFQPNNPLEPAVIATLNPGAYTAIVQGAGGVTGVGVVGVFEVDHPETPLINISTRGQVLTGNDVMIAGFVIQGSTPQKVVVNVAGPSLVPFGIANALANPSLTLVRGSDNAVIASNDNWQTQGVAGDLAAIVASGFQPSNPLEPAVIATLQPGAYTAIVQGAGGTTGVGLVGVFRTP